MGLLPLLPARQTEDECREAQLPTGTATSIKKAAMLVYLAAAHAGSRGNVGKLCPLQDTANPIKGPAFGNWILKFPDLFFATRKPVTARVITEPRLRWFNSAFASRTDLPGLQTLQRCSGFLNRRARGSTVATHQFNTPVAQIIRVRRFERHGCRRESCREYHFHGALAQLEEASRLEREG